MIGIGVGITNLNNSLVHGGEPGSPDWLPMGAFGFVDFANGRYWNGAASVSVTDVIGDDTDGAFGRPFVQSQVIATQGYVGDSTAQTGGQFIGALKTAILQGSSMVVEFDLTGISGGGAIFLYSPDYATALNFDVSGLTNIRDDNNYTFDIGPNATGGQPALGVGTHKVGVRLVDGDWAIVADGGTVYAASNTLGTAPITETSIQLNDGVTVRRIANYDPVDDAALSALTAP